VLRYNGRPLFGFTPPCQINDNTREQTPLIELDCRMAAGTELVLPAAEAELALYVAEGSVAIDGHGYAAGVMAVARQGKTVRREIVRARQRMPPRSSILAAASCAACDGPGTL
jgi:hypothetical protein